jgi:hypothetical protein
VLEIAGDIALSRDQKNGKKLKTVIEVQVRGQTDARYRQSWYGPRYIHRRGESTAELLAVLGHASSP